MKTRLSSVAVMALVWLVWVQRADAQNVGFREPEVKAVYLFNFAQFVQWPAGAFADRRSAFVIGRTRSFSTTPTRAEHHRPSPAK